MSSPMQAVPFPLQAFLESLQQSGDNGAIIKVPAKLIEKTTQYLSELSSVPRNHVEAMLAVIDRQESAICSRLELPAFTIIYEILSLTEEGSAYERGLALLTQSLFESPNSSLPESRLRVAKKIEVGDIALLNLFGCFTTTELSRSTRRWMGILALELLKDCGPNKNLLLQRASDVGKRLSDIILHERCHVLKLIAGLIVREIWPDGTPARDLWPRQHDSELYRPFPKANSQVSQWIIDFESFVGNLAPDGLRIELSSEVVFAYAVIVGEKTYSVDEQSVILVTISNELNIVIPADTGNSANYLDIDISQIEKITDEKKDFHLQSSSSPSKLFEVLTIWISKASEEACYFNARELCADSINLVFTSVVAASTVRQSVLSMRSRIGRNLETSQSEPVDISQLLSEDFDEPSPMQLATHLSEEPSNDLANAISQGNENQSKSEDLVAHLSIPECDKFSPGFTYRTRSKASVASPNETDSPQVMTLIDAAISPIEPHQFDELSHKLTTVEYNFENTSDDELPSPAKRIDRFSQSENDQAIRDRQRNLWKHYRGVPAQGCQFKLPSVVDEDDDSLYHAKTVTYTSRKKDANRANSRSCETVDQRGASKISPRPGVKAGNLGRQGLTKLSQRLRRDVGEPPVGLPDLPELAHDDAAKGDERRIEVLRPAVKRNRLSPNGQHGDFELSRVQSKRRVCGNSTITSADNQNRRGEYFDFPTSAEKAQKAPKVPVSHLPTPIAIMYAQDSSKSRGLAKTKPVPPKCTPNCSKRPESRIRDGVRPKAITNTTTFIPSKRIRYSGEDDTTDQTDRAVGLGSHAKGPERPQRQSKKQSNRKSQPRPKHITAWDDLAFSTHKAQNAKPNKSGKQPKHITAKDELTFSTHKAQNAKPNKSGKPMAVPVSLAKSRTRRVAALNANKRIQDLTKSDASEDEENDEQINEKGKSKSPIGQKPTTPLRKNNSETNADPRPSLATSREHEGQIEKVHERDTTSTVFPSVMPTNCQKKKAGSLDSVDLLTNELVPSVNGVIHSTKMRQGQPMNRSDTFPLDGHSGHQLQNELLNVYPRKLEVQNSTPAINSSTLTEQNHVHNEIIPLHTFTSKTVVPEILPSDDLDALNNTGGGFFEDATAFSHEDTSILAKPLTDKGTSQLPMRDSNFKNTRDPNACENPIIDKTSRVANASKNSIKSTPKVSIAAKLQSALSSVKNMRFSARTEKKQKAPQSSASVLTDVTAPVLDKTVRGKMAARDTKTRIAFRNQLTTSDAERRDRGPVIENDLQKLKRVLQPREIRPTPTVDSVLPTLTKSSHRTPTMNTQIRVPVATSHALEATDVAGNGVSDKVTSVSEISLQRVLESPKSLSLNADCWTNSECFKRNQQGQISSATILQYPQYGLQGGSKQERDSARSANVAPMSNPGAFGFEDEVVSAENSTRAPLDSDRKPNVISFDSKGPRNQGMVSSLRAKPIQASEDQKPEMSSAFKENTLKRTIQELGYDSFGAVQNYVIVKRPRTSVDVPRTRENAPEKPQKPGISIIKESTQKPSSQSTRVDENGSPLPFVRSRKKGRQISFETAAQSPVTQQGAKDRHDLCMSMDGFEVLSPGSPILEDSPVPSASSFCFVASSCIKHRPSSPNAPSGTFEDYTAHKVDSSGNFVNIRTDNVVMAVRPPDPFVGIQQNQSNNFIELLRRSSSKPDQISLGNVTSLNEDPDKTLLTRDVVQEKSKPDAASSSSSSLRSDSSQSNEHSPPDPPSSEGGSNEVDEWAAALKPHQGETLEVLYEISHRLVSNLVSKEKAVNDLASDYRRGGLRIIDQFEKSRQQILQTYQTELGIQGQKLAKTYEQALHELAEARIDPKLTADYGVAQENYHNTLMKKIEEGFAMCED
ncbi:hypothetical protein MMC07_006962 [Pseudocyphellaria aurata]|nr:hypothetical protein [Pseudocyphellaria aurata]